MKKNKITNTIVIPVFALLLVSSYGQGQELHNEIKTKNEIEIKGEVSVKEKLPPIKYANITSEKDSTETLVEKFKEARKHNKENRKKAVKYYNPVTFIYRLIGL